jgi:hypothetical protein
MFVGPGSLLLQRLIVIINSCTEVFVKVGGGRDEPTAHLIQTKKEGKREERKKGKKTVTANFSSCASCKPCPKTGVGNAFIRRKNADRIDKMNKIVTRVPNSSDCPGEILIRFPFFRPFPFPFPV